MVDPYNNQKKDNVIEFKPKAKTSIEHVDSSTIVERLEMTDELKQLFEEQGYQIDENRKD